MSNQLERNIEYFDAHKADVIREAGGRPVVLIADRAVVAFFDDELTAVQYARGAEIQPGFLVRHVFETHVPLVATNFAIVS